MSSPSPPSPLRERADSVISLGYKTTKASSMMKIQSLLNPPVMGSPTATNNSTNPPLTPAYTAAESTGFSTPQSTTTVSDSAGRDQKSLRDDKPFTIEVNYPPFEIHERPICLSSADQEELYRKHKQFKIKVGPDGARYIADHTRHIPYSSDKKDFLEKTGRDGFNVFEYDFQLPGDGDGKVYTVMWDYDNGLVRITPFFKACKYSKTTPAKAISVNTGVKELSHSITGGALKAQGYWLPYQCARAICETFCWHIRWPLVHIFGPSFIHDCLLPNHPNYGKFKIRKETVHNATLQAEAWKPSNKIGHNTGGIPRSTPNNVDTITCKELRPRFSKPTFKEGSPFDSDNYATDNTCSYRLATPLADSPGISPKSAYREHTITPSGWTSINRQRSSPPSPPNNSPVGTPLSKALLTQPHFASWRDAEPVGSLTRNTKMMTPAHDKQHSTKRRRSSRPHANVHPTYVDSHSTSDADVSESESDDVEIPLSPAPAKKRAKYHHGSKNGGMWDASPKIMRKRKDGGKSKHFTAEDARAAKVLMSLAFQDQDLANGPNGPARAGLTLRS